MPLLAVPETTETISKVHRRYDLTLQADKHKTTGRDPRPEINKLNSRLYVLKTCVYNVVTTVTRQVTAI